MRLFGLSSLDTLLSLLLVELTWWGIVFFGQFVPSFLYKLVMHFQPSPTLGRSGPVDYESEESHTMSGDIISHKEYHFNSTYDDTTEKKKEWSRELTILVLFGIMLVLRVKTPFLLLITVLKNRVNEHCQLIRIWYWMMIILDVLLLVFIGVLELTFDPKIMVRLLFHLLPVLIARVIFWSLAKEVVAELGTKERTLFPTVGFKGVFAYLGSNVSSALKVLLSWEILTNIMLLLFSITSAFSGGYYWAVIAPDMYGFVKYLWGTFPLILIWAMHLTISCVTTIQLIGVHRDWKTLMKFLVVLYILFGLIGPLAVEGLMTMESFNSAFEMTITDLSSGTINYISIGIGIVIYIGQISLKLFLVWFTFKFFQPASHEKEEHTALRHPLLSSDELLKEKQFE